MRQPSAEMQKFINKHNGDPMNIKKHKQATKSKAIVPTEAFNLPTWFEDGVFTKGAVNKKGVRSLRGVSESSIKNIILILKNDPKAPKPFYDEFSELLMYADDKGRYIPWDKPNSNILKYYIESNFDYTPTPSTVDIGLRAYAMQYNTRNLVKERVETVAWDGIPRIESLFVDFLGAPNSHYTKEITKRWFTGMIKRVYEPGCKFELVPVLYGGQGIGKSDLVSSIFPNSFVDNLGSMKDKDDLLKLNSKMVAEISELKAFNASSTDEIKNFISSRNDNYRSPYGETTKDHARKTVFIGTTNKPTFLKDDTGERRFYPIWCNGDAATKNPHKVDDSYMLQALAEAKALYTAGYKHYIDIKEDSELVEIAKEEQERAKEKSMVDDEIEQYLESTTPPDYEEKYFKLSLDDKRSIYEQSMSEAPAVWIKIPYVTTKDIWAVGLKQDPDKMTIRGKNSDSKAINDRMFAKDGWAFVERLRGKKSHGYIRK
ncbi:hypothetical protein FC36_GL000463 [Ligilactobacillus equi DSM 15833 = JCM 10991]|uniref:Virulence-associated protein E-like domain-containing protein n=1 Tax=Ligilactobacillus equi DSM 15833 = JCM 10991 TaxID=1423740 RepID=A0A0R1TQE1_9LACO|nr:virulence-associated E family protein [Ligilactobacillus equi]KRL79515.1 hypothetical protein FC36_GL000463 [Ligilactobacillus equi DSM 15833 = JCM 10991]